MTTRMIGDVPITHVEENPRLAFPPGDLLPDLDPEALDKHAAWLRPDHYIADEDLVVMSVHSWVIKTARHTILVDTCSGNHKERPSLPPFHQLDVPYMERLAAAGVHPEQVDFVMCTHLHLDHVGWNTRLENGRWVPTFPNAKYILAGDEYAASEAGDDQVFRENVLPVMEAGQAVLVDTDYALDDEVWLVPTPGHTVGHVAVNIASRVETAVMCGDLMHTPLQLAHPEWSPNFDHDGVRAAETRKSFLDKHCETDTLILTAHFPSPSVGHIVPHAERRFDFSYL